VSLEFGLALVLILFPLMFGIIDFSRALYAYHWVSYAAREGTRWASVRGANCTLLSGGCPADLAGLNVKTYVQSIVAPGIYSQACSGPGTNAGCISATTTYLNTNALPLSGPDCTGGQGLPLNTPGCIVEVTVNYNFGFSLPFLFGKTGSVMKLQSTSQMVISQ
jgi:TadE-like protein